MITLSEAIRTVNEAGLVVVPPEPTEYAKQSVSEFDCRYPTFTYRSMVAKCAIKPEDVK